VGLEARNDSIEAFTDIVLLGVSNLRNRIFIRASNLCSALLIDGVRKRALEICADIASSPPVSDT
jgi:hypothetical protein